MRPDQQNIAPAPYDIRVALEAMAATGPRPLLPVAAMRAAEAAAFARGVAPAALMERAGAAAADLIARRFVAQPMLVLCGPGNNGGDGYVVARQLLARGWPVRVAAAGPPRAQPARTAAARWAGPVEPIATAAPAPLIVDALFGIGLTRPLEAAWSAPLARLASAARAVIAIDLPSGVEADSGALLGAPPRAALTIALGALKPAHRLEPGASRCGIVDVAGLGLDLSGARTWELAQPRLPAPAADVHKYARGAVLVLAGPPGRGGAARLAARAALRAGAGVVTLACPPEAVAEHAARLDAIMVRALPGPDGLAALVAERRASVLVLGPGLGTDGRARALAEAALALDVALVLDADIFTLFAGEPGALRRAGSTILTPHAGEAARLAGAAGGSKLNRAGALADATGALVLLKGPDTVVAAPGGAALVQHAPAPWLATAGSGDVLAGAMAGRLACGDAPALAAAAAAWAHARAGQLARLGLSADDLPELVAAQLAGCIGP